MTSVLLSLTTLLATLAGGLFALRLRHRLHFILAFTAGVLIGVVAFDILPEMFRLAQQHATDVGLPMLALVGGFLLIHGVRKFVLAERAAGNGVAAHRQPQLGVLAALVLISHSFLDGVGIGLGFQVSPAAGITVAAAVIAHDFCDGINTVSLMLVHRNSARRSLAMLLLDALAPVLGAAATLVLQVPPTILVPYLGFFAGFLLYVGASDILPAAYAQTKPANAPLLVALTCLGAASMYLVAHLAG